MNYNNWQYQVCMNMGSYGIWDNTGTKVASFGKTEQCRYEALCVLYHLNGWDWNRSKYVRTNPALANLDITKYINQ